MSEDKYKARIPKDAQKRIDDHVKNVEDKVSQITSTISRIEKTNDVELLKDLRLDLSTLSFYLVNEGLKFYNRIIPYYDRKYYEAKDIAYDSYMSKGETATTANRKTRSDDRVVRFREKRDEAKAEAGTLRELCNRIDQILHAVSSKIHE